MKHIAFSYTDAKNITKQRSIIVIQEPNVYVTGYDVSELPENEVESMSAALGLALDAFRTEQLRIASEFNCDSKYRQFIPSRMSDVVAEYL